MNWNKIVKSVIKCINGRLKNSKLYSEFTFWLLFHWGAFLHTVIWRIRWWVTVFLRRMWCLGWRQDYMRLRRLQLRLILVCLLRIGSWCHGLMHSLDNIWTRLNRIGSGLTSYSYIWRTMQSSLSCVSFRTGQVLEFIIIKTFHNIYLIHHNN